MARRPRSCRRRLTSAAGDLETIDLLGACIELGKRAGTPQPLDKTTIYLPTELKLAIKRVARQRGVSEAEVIRNSIRDAVGDDRPRARGGLFASRAPIAREADEHLPGFGEQ